MPVPAFRNSRSRVRRRRSHHALKAIQTATCAKCGVAILSHRACAACGAYAERSVKATGMQEVEKVLDKKAKKPAKKSKAVAAEAPVAEAPADKPTEIKA